MLPDEKIVTLGPNRAAPCTNPVKNINEVTHQIILLNFVIIIKLSSNQIYVICSIISNKK